MSLSLKKTRIIVYISFQFSKEILKNLYSFTKILMVKFFAISFTIF